MLKIEFFGRSCVCEKTSMEECIHVAFLFLIWQRLDDHHSLTCFSILFNQKSLILSFAIFTITILSLFPEQIVIT